MEKENLKEKQILNEKTTKSIIARVATYSDPKRRVTGVTLIALIITIIIMLILLGVTINIALDGGLFSTAKEAVKQTQIKAYQEELDLIRPNVEMKRYAEGLTSKEYMDYYEEEIKKDNVFKDSTVTRKDENTTVVVTSEGYVFEITEEETKYIGQQDENKPNVDPGENDIKFIYNPNLDTWTNRSVEVTIETQNTEYTLQYSTDGTTWQQYTKPIVTENNTVIHAKLVNNLYQEMASATGNVGNIDKLAPTSVTIENSSATTDSITIEGSATDAIANETSGSSGIEKYYFSKDGGDSWEPINGQNSNKYTFSGLTQGEEYTIRVKAVDKAGNEGLSLTENITTGKMPGGSDSISFDYSPTDWTKGSVNVTIKTTVDTNAYTLQYSKDESIWIKYTEPVEMTENGPIYARLVNSKGKAGETATGRVEKIDKLAPTLTVENTKTTNSVTLSATAEDQKATNTSGCSGIKEYYYSNNGGDTWTSAETTDTYTFNDLTQNTEYTFKVKVKDKAENETTSDDIKVKTWLVPGGSSNISFDYSEKKWTNQPVKVTIKTTAGTEYKLQYSKDKGTWKNYVDKVEMTENGPIYARLIDSKEQAGEIVTGNVENIDIAAPQIGTQLKSTGNTTSKITLSTTATDSLSGISKIVWYYKLSSVDSYTSIEEVDKTMNGTEKGQTTAVTKTKEITGLEANKTYNIYAEIYDVAGNSTRTPSNGTTDVKTSSMPTTSSIGFTYSNKNWTNQPVNVTIKTTAGTEYKLQYSTDGDTWTDYETAVKMKTNGDIYARLVDKTNTNNVSATATGNVSNIDTAAPQIGTQLKSTASTVSSITLSTTATDSLSGISKIVWYYKLSGTNSGYTSIEEIDKAMNGTEKGKTTAVTKTKKITGLEENKTYNTYAVIYDVAGNSKRTPLSGTKDVSTTSMPTASAIGFEYSNEDWTNESVYVTITTTEDTNEYTLQYSTDGEIWTDYETEIEMTRNGSIYARLVDKTNTNNVSATATGSVSNIDKIKPSVMVGIEEITKNSITTKAIAGDDMNGSGIETYLYSIDGDEWSSSMSDTHTFYSLKEGTEYTVYIKVIDRAGNEQISRQERTMTVGILFKYIIQSGANNEKLVPGWTYYNVLVKIKSQAPAGYKLQYSLDGNIWQDYVEGNDYYKAGITMTETGPIYARLINNSNQILATSTGNVYIDKNAPRPATLEMRFEDGTKFTGKKAYGSLYIELNDDASDDQSGVLLSRYHVRNEDENELILTNQTDGIQLTDPGNYTLIVETIDRAGNRSFYPYFIEIMPSPRLKIGDYIDYEPSSIYSMSVPAGTYTSDNNAFSSASSSLTPGSGINKTQVLKTTDYDGKWRILNIDKTTGEIELISEKSVGTLDLRGLTGVRYGVHLLNSVSSIYGHGKGATSARSINVDDVNKITGYNPNNVGVDDPNQTGEGTKYGKGNYYEYGKLTGYTWTSQNYINNNSRYSTEYVKYGFNYINFDTGVGSSKSYNKSYPVAATSTSTLYEYYPNTLTTTQTNVTIPGPNYRGYGLLFTNSDGGTGYWLADNYYENFDNYIYYGIRCVGGDSRYDMVRGKPLYTSYGLNIEESSYGIRPVVIMGNGIKINGGNGTSSSPYTYE